jgi:hypothetical protein
MQALPTPHFGSDVLLESSTCSPSSISLAGRSPPLHGTSTSDGGNHGRSGGGQQAASHARPASSEVRAGERKIWIVTVVRAPIVSGELHLPLYLRGVGLVFGDHQFMGMSWDLLELRF